MIEPLPNIKKACLVFGTLFAFSVPIIWISLFFTNHHGDLTRVGRWREADFAWQIEQPEIAEVWLKNDPINEADVLVIGDSFSISLHWQSVLKKNRIKVSTLAWSEISHLCKDFPDQLALMGFKGKFIVIESIERLASIEIKKSLNCSTGKKFNLNTIKKVSPSPTKIYLKESFNIHGQFISGAKTIFNSIAIRAIPHYSNLYNLTSSSKEVKILKLEDGCSLFSNNLCNFGLFYKEDFTLPSLDESTLDNLLMLNERLKATNAQLIWAIIPNKSSIYTNRGSEKIWNGIEKNKLGPNLYKTFQSKKLVEIDLYAPNDTHFSNKGYILLGNEILKYMRY